jgi:hypothetical protein
MKTLRSLLIPFAGATLVACGDGGGGSISHLPPPPPTATTYTVSVTDVEIVEQGTDERVAIDNLPIEGATLTD